MSFLNFFNFFLKKLKKIEHYKRDGSYSIFAGKDCSVSLAKMSFDAVYLNCSNEVTLNPKEEETLSQWFEKFREKYNIVGKIKY